MIEPEPGGPRDHQRGSSAWPTTDQRPAAVLWLPGLAVALGAAFATAHGLFEVALASRVPTGIAWLYPLITDGLALVAYAATARLRGPAARYAWTVVIVAAGLSGLAQACYLAGGPTVEVAPALRFGIGAWPAIAAAIVAHLLYLLATEDAPPVRPGVMVSDASVQPYSVQPDPARTADSPLYVDPAAVQPDPDAVRRGESDAAPEATRALPSPARDRAAAAAADHLRRHGALPTVSELEAAAEVSRGTAAAALRSLREHPAPLRLITDTAPTGPDDPESEINP